MGRTLFWRLFLPVMGVFLVILAVLAWMIPAMITDNAERNAVQTAEETVAQYKQLRAYYTKNVITKVLGQGGLKPSFDHEGNAKAVPLPATMIHDLSELMQEKGIRLSLYSDYPFPNRASRKLDAFERDAWQQIRKNSERVHVDTEERNGETWVRVGVADTMDAQACVNCHNSRPDTPKNDWKLGEVRGILEVQTNIQAELIAGQSISRNLIIMLVVLFVVLSGVLWLVYRRAIGKRLEDVAHAMQDIADGGGDLTRRLDDAGEHEIARIGQAFNRFAGSLQELISQVSLTSGELNECSVHLNSISNQTVSSLSQQEQETQQVATAVTEMSATAQEISGNAESAAAATGKTREATQAGEKAMANSIQSTQELERDILQAAEALNELQLDSQNIGGVLDVIRGIAEQTNLLALNAAIEAARAGEQGRGFAVVADEVRTLAGKTQESTQEIQETTQRLQDATQKMVQAMDVNRDKVATTVKLAGEVESHLGHISSSVNVIADMNTQIATAATEQGQVAGEVDSNLLGISQMSQANADNARQTDGQVEVLNGLVRRLQDLTGQFKV